MNAYLTIAGADYIVGYDYKITAAADPGYGPTYSSGGEPPSPMEYEVEFIDLRKDEGGGKETSVECPSWLKAEIETWLYEDADGKIYAAIEEDAADSYGDELDNYAERDD